MKIRQQQQHQHLPNVYRHKHTLMVSFTLIYLWENGKICNFCCVFVHIYNKHMCEEVNICSIEVYSVFKITLIM